MNRRMETLHIKEPKLLLFLYKTVYSPQLLRPMYETCFRTNGHKSRIVCVSLCSPYMRDLLYGSNIFVIKLIY